jgi:membrane protein involved in colicin uptake
MSTELMTVALSDYSINSTDEAKEIASNLHTELTAIATVTTPDAQLVATNVARDAQSFLKRLEASRKAVKSPVLEIGRKVDALADELAAQVKAEMQRVGALVAKFQQAEAIRVEQERIERQKREAEAMAAARDAARKERELAEKMQSEADFAKALEAEAEAKRKEAAMYATLTAPQPAAIKAEGSATRRVLRYEVTDIKAAYAAAPHLFSVEIKPSAVTSTCNKDTVIPGMRFWEELTTSFRSR